MNHKLIIIGGGAAGLVAGITAKDMGYDVAIVEGTDRIGKKILTTGNGRCNISNLKIKDDRYHSENSDFSNKILNKYDLEYTENFFKALGLPIISLDSDKLYPMSLQASSVVDVLKLAIEDRNIPLHTNFNITKVKKEKNAFILLSETGEELKCEKVILCTGGMSAPKTGSKGIGYKLAKQLGHSITELQPSLVQLKLTYPHLKALSGIKFDGTVDIFVDDVQKKSEFGEILFTDYGISGIPIFQISRIASFALSKGKKVTLKIDLLPNLSTDALKDFLENHFGLFSYRSIHDAFIGVINKKLIPTLLKECEIKNIHGPVYELDYKEKSQLFKNLKQWEFHVSGHNSFNNAQVTAGGINTLEVCDTTLESKITTNLYFAGEVLDVDGDCGGFNLQWAWSSGFAAAIAACSK
ncbi:MAG: NAD(P)/FAD-dependent oxidoreductase [Clostridiaceae bacterium]